MLHVLPEKNRVFDWTPAAGEAFDTLKQALVSSPILAYPDPNAEFILDTDASNFGIGSVLSQVQDGHEKVIAYYSKTLNKPERRYCVTRRELLAIVASVKHFHHYLYGRKFRIRTDHGALRWLMQFKHPEAQVARWIEVLDTYSFEIEYRPGRNHGNADALSRIPCEGMNCVQCERMEHNMQERPIHVPARLPKAKLSDNDKQNRDVQETGANVFAVHGRNTNDSWIEEKSSTEIRQAQLRDPIIGKILRYKESGSRPLWSEISIEGTRFKTYWAQWDNLLVKEGILYMGKVANNAVDDESITEQVPHSEDGRIRSPSQRKECNETGAHQRLIVPNEWHSEILHQLHSVKTAGHLGIAKTLQRVGQRYYWVGYVDDVKSYVKNCPQCTCKQKPKPNAPMKLYQTGAPMERIALDILGPLPETEYGNKYILCIGDYFTKWVEAIPLPDQEAKTVADALISTICRIGIPRQIHTDQGRNFQSTLFSELCEMLDIDKTRTTPYRPQSDGMIERFNRTLAAMLRNFVSQEQKDWDIQLPYVMMAYRSAVHNSTGYSPNQMMLGREVNLPLDLVIGRHLEKENPDEYVQRQRQTLQEVHTLARANLKLSGESQKRNYDLRQSRTKFKFEVGQSVWYYCPMKRKGISPKLQTQWYGPCKVKKQISDLLYVIETPRTLYKKVQDIVVHCNKLRPYTAENENYYTESHTTPDKTGMTTSDREQGDSTPYISKYGRTVQTTQWYGLPQHY